MKHLLPFLIAAAALLSCRSGPAAVTNVAATVTFTNVVRGVTNGDTITINGSVRRYTNGVLNSAPLWILSTNIVGHAATNTWLHLAVYTPAGIDSVTPTNTNSLVIVSTFATNTTLAVSVSAGVGTVTYATNVYADVRSLVFPNAALPTEAARTNNASGLIGLLNDSRQTNSVNNGVIALSNLIDRTSSQGLGNKALTNSSLDTTRITNAPNVWGSNFNVVTLRATNGALYGMTNSGIIALLTNGTIYNVNLVGATNAGYISALTNGSIYNVNLVGATNAGYIRALTNGLLVNAALLSPSVTNLVSYGNAISSPGAGVGAEQFGTTTLANGDYTLAVGYSALAEGTNSLALGFGASTSVDAESSIAIGRSAIADLLGVRGMAIGYFALANNTNAIAIGYGAEAVHANSTAFGNGVTTTADDQIMLGMSAHSVTIPGAALIARLTNTSVFNLTNGVLGRSWLEFNTITNSIVRGTNTWNGDINFTPRANANPVNGNNANVNISTNVYITVSGPTTIGVYCGFLAGRDGDYRILRFSGAITNTLANESGFEGTAAQRIVTGTGGDISMTNSPSFATVIYDATSARWRVVTHSR